MNKMTAGYGRNMFVDVADEINQHDAFTWFTYVQLLSAFEKLLSVLLAPTKRQWSKLEKVGCIWNNLSGGNRTNIDDFCGWLTGWFILRQITSFVCWIAFVINTQNNTKEWSITLMIINCQHGHFYCSDSFL